MTRQMMKLTHECQQLWKKVDQVVSGKDDQSSLCSLTNPDVSGPLGQRCHLRQFVISLSRERCHLVFSPAAACASRRREAVKMVGTAITVTYSTFTTEPSNC